MRRIAIVVAVTAALLAAAPSAFGAQKLLFSGQSAPVAPGEGVRYALSLAAVNAAAECERFEQGTDTTNGKGTDKFAFGTVTQQACSTESSLGGVTKEVKVSAKGTITLKSTTKLIFRIPGPCVYDLSKLTGTFTPGGRAHADMAGVGKLNKKASSIHCGVAEEFLAFTALLDEDFNLLNDELTS
jgi:hypothetical protein